MARRGEVLTRADVLRVAAAARLDPRTVARAVEGGAPRSAAVLDLLITALRVEGFPATAARLAKGAA